MAKIKFGHMPCMGVKEDGATVCGERVVVWENEKGTLSCNCQECGQSDYAKKGDFKYPRWARRIARAPAAEPAADPQPAPAPKAKEGPPAAPPKVEAKPARRPTSLLDEAAGG